LRQDEQMTLGLRERKKLATRHALHAAALELVAERGLDRVSVDDIAERADVSPRTFFNYFASKVDAVIGWDPSYARRLADAFAARPRDESPVDALREVLVADAAEMAREPRLWRLRMRVMDGNPTLMPHLAAGFAVSERVLASAIADRTGTRTDRDLYPILLAAVQGTVIRTALQRWAASDFRASLPALVAQAWSLVTAGLPPPRA
jgi:AcrR family transcriptional regulator